MTVLFLLLWFVLFTFFTAVLLLVWATFAKPETGTRPIIVADRPKPDLRVTTTNPPVLVIENVISNVRFPINH